MSEELKQPSDSGSVASHCSSSVFTGDDAHEDGERLVAAIEVALEDEAQQLRKKILKVEQLGYACPSDEIVESRHRLAQIDEMLSK